MRPETKRLAQMLLSQGMSIDDVARTLSCPGDWWLMRERLIRAIESGELAA